jgi:hypothetical protein
MITGLLITLAWFVVIAAIVCAAYRCGVWLERRDYQRQKRATDDRVWEADDD